MELPSLFWERPCLIKIDTYFQDFPNPPTQLKQLLFLNPTTVWHCLRQTDRNQFPHLYNSFDLAEKRSPHVSAVCCFLLWQFSFIPIQPAFNAFIVHCLNLPKGQNANSGHKCHPTIQLISYSFCFYICIWDKQILKKDWIISQLTTNITNNFDSLKTKTLIYQKEKECLTKGENLT